MCISYSSRRASLLAASALALFSSVVGSTRAAEGGGPYAGFGAGMARGSIGDSFDEVLRGHFGSATKSEQRTEAAGRAFVGYRLSPNVAIEGGWGSYGSVEAKARTTLPLATVEVERDTTAFCLDAVGTLPVAERIDVVGRLGVARWRVAFDSTTSLPVSGVSEQFDRKVNGSSVHVGFGLQYRFAERAHFFLEAEGFKAGKGDVVEKRNVVALLAGIKVGF